MKSRYTLSQSQKRYSFLEAVYNSVTTEGESDAVESRREEEAGDHPETKVCEAKGQQQHKGTTEGGESKDRG